MFTLTSDVEGDKIINEVFHVHTSAGIGAGYSHNLGQYIIRDLLLVSNGLEPLNDTVLTDLTHGTNCLAIAFGSERVEEL